MRIRRMAVDSLGIKLVKAADFPVCPSSLKSCFSAALSLLLFFFLMPSNPCRTPEVLNKTPLNPQHFPCLKDKISLNVISFFFSYVGQLEASY